MRIGELIRNNAFVLLDSLRTESINKYVRELQSFENNEYDYAIVREKLNEFLIRAQNSSPFYANKKKEFDLNAYPVISKKK